MGVARQIAHARIRDVTSVEQGHPLDYGRFS
jgi:hypothetical protein